MDITSLRGQLDQVDSELMALFVKRMQLVEQIARCKREQGIDIFVPAREAGKLRKAAAAGGDYADSSRRLMECLLEISRDYQDSLRQK